jgi:hypothetical protein
VTAQAALEALRASGAWQRDPVRFHTLEALARRLPEQPEAVRRLLQQKLEAGLAALSAQPPAPRRAAPAAVGCAPLADLNRRFGVQPAGARELASVQRFRETWAFSHALDQVRDATARKPAQAGPLNSHALVLQSLELMRALSPDYLRHFVAQVEALQWLEDAAATLPRGPAKGKAKKTARRK